MHRIIIVTAVIAILVFMIYMFFGGCSKIRITEGIDGGEKVVYKTVKGDYPQTEVASADIVAFLQNKYSIKVYTSYSYYNANPHVTTNTYLKSEGGCIIPEDINPDTTLNKDYKCKSLPKEKFILCHLPYKGKISILISSVRFYPKLYNYLLKKGYNVNSPVTEIFDSRTGEIVFRAKIENDK